ncbi:outer membrane protein assembly factor BamB family protein [Neorhodopirellula pilleata]|uniref:Outer membrane biogenesis protein BamB n=1 Tax=Neorhodopirellula pilleata TaxID=2714738 RepID=A0A5C5ZII5_9BACT|nr:PQQ-binding-like beta-propeller repeat protein [Neorhodopirellula pilleata]TWT86353.1 outer membrane biogenesis protein BamB [Neorhodopirellula pilleata]
MLIRLCLVCLSFIIVLQKTSVIAETPATKTPSFSVSDWPWWRGPTGDGHAVGQQTPPLNWTSNENLLWKQPIPGRGHAAPTVVGDAIYLPTADRERDVQTVICLDRASGKPSWETTVHRGGLMKKNEKASQASSTIACDGERLFVNFLNNGAVFTSAISLDGEVLWQRKISDYVLHQGYGSSPTIYKHLVIVAADNKGGGAIVALDRRSGEEVWRQARPKKPNYSSPVVLNVSGREQLIMIGCDLVSGFDPLTGEKLWEFPGATTECVITTVTDGDLIYTSGGYPRNHLAAVRGDGSGEVVWETGDRIYVPSLLIQDDYLYAVFDAGVAACWRADTGEQQWKARLGGNYTASPVLVGDRIYATSEDGETIIFSATPERFEKLAENKLADDAFATPVIVADRIYARMGVREGDQRQEYLFCIGE